MIVKNIPNNSKGRNPWIVLVANVSDVNQIFNFYKEISLLKWLPIHESST